MCYSSADFRSAQERVSWNKTMTRYEGGVRDDMLALTEYLGQPNTMRICRLGDKCVRAVGASGVVSGMTSIEKLEECA